MQKRAHAPRPLRTVRTRPNGAGAGRPRPLTPKSPTPSTRRATSTAGTAGTEQTRGPAGAAGRTGRPRPAITTVSE